MTAILRRLRLTEQGDGERLNRLCELVRDLFDLPSLGNLRSDWDAEGVSKRTAMRKLATK